ncbi:MAG: host attachment protein [Akkermansiaceae bacterium]|nr:host attachment protein [Akkermansiaceae bacterium]
MNLPSIIIAANRGHLVAYRKTENDSLQPIDNASFKEGNANISDLVTDQAGAFPMSGTPGTGSFESLPLVAELEVRSFRKVAERIGRILDEEDIPWWGFASPSEINGAILDHLKPQYREKVSISLKSDLTNSPKEQVYQSFAKAARETNVV